MKGENMHIGGIAYKKVGLNGDTSERLMRLLDKIEGFNHLTDFEELLAEVSKVAKSIMQAEASSLMLLDKETDELTIVSSTGPIKDEVKSKKIAKTRGFSGWVAEHKLPLIANDIDPDNEFFGGELSDNFRTINLICAPLMDAENNVIGVIEAINHRSKPKLEEQDIPIFQALAKHAATAILRVQAEKEKGNRLKEQDVYLTEIHHRVKNDLALISGIVEIESLDIESDEAKGVLRDIQSRIKSMAVVYELLSGEGSHNRAEVGTYFKKLVNGISNNLQTKNKSIDIQVNTESVVVDPYKALSCGLILNELLLNSYKHAFDAKDAGLISVDLSKTGRQVTISYKDNGQGLPEDFDLEEQDSLGFKMIDALVKQLNGTLEFFTGDGAHFIIRFETNENATEKQEPVLNG